MNWLLIAVAALGAGVGAVIGFVLGRAHGLVLGRWQARVTPPRPAPFRVEHHGRDRTRYEVRP